MPGRNNSTNKFGFSSYVVGPLGTLGNGSNYDSIQTAIDDVFAAGGGVVLVRPGTYTENLTFRNGVDLFGASVDGRLPTGLGQIDVVGNHSFTAITPFEIVVATNINFATPLGDLFTLAAAGGNNAIVAMQDCGLRATTDPASRVMVLNGGLGSSVQFSTDNCLINSASHVFECVGAGSGSANLQFGNASSSSGAILEVTTGSGSLGLEYTQASASTYIANNPTGINVSVTFNYCDAFSSLEAVFIGLSGNLNAFHCNIQSFAPSGFFIDGVAGSLSYDNVVFQGTATGIGAAITQTVFDWKPYGTTTNVGVNRYNPIDFTVNLTTGEVSAIASGAFPWIDQGLSVTVLSNTGNFTTAVITLTLPAAPVQGDVCKFKQVTNDNIVVAANAGQIIQLGTAGGTQAASSASGDALECTYYAAGAIWIANSGWGNWVVS